MQPFLKSILIMGPLVAGIGALNWGFVGAFDWDAVAALAGGATRHDVTALTRAIYLVVGAAGLCSIGVGLKHANFAASRFK